MNLPTPNTDPTGFVAAVVALTAAVFTAIDPTGTLGGRWQPVVIAAVTLLALLWARRHAWRPASVDRAVEDALGIGRGQAERELELLATAKAKRSKPSRPRRRGA